VRLPHTVELLHEPDTAPRTQYKATDIVVKEAGKLELVFTPDNKSNGPTNLEVFQFKGPGVGLAMYNTVQSIRDFAQSSFKMAIEKKMPLVRQPVLLVRGLGRLT
jgi:isocitrate dehydrogenase